MAEKELVSNRAAYHNYEILESIEAGIVLTGTEIKSLRDHGGNLQDNYVAVVAGEAWLKLASIAPYSHGNLYNHEEKRERKLLLHRSEIEKLKKQSKIKGYTLVALSLYLNSKGIVKVKLGIGKGKKDYDKRAALKKHESVREIQRALKQ